MSKNKRSPGCIRWTHVQYIRGASRSVEVFLRTIANLKLSCDESMVLLGRFGNQMKRMQEEKDTKSPFIDRAVNLTLLSLQNRKRGQ